MRAILELQDPTADAIANRLDALLEDLSIAHLRRRAGACRCPAASGGACEIARALATRPRFILLDEPFAGVDPIAVLDIQRIIGFLKERGIGVLITDHNVRETLGICDRAYIINEGRVLASGSRTRLSIMRRCERSISASISGCDADAARGTRR